MTTTTVDRNAIAAVLRPWVNEWMQDNNTVKQGDFAAAVSRDGYLLDGGALSRLLNATAGPGVSRELCDALARTSGKSPEPLYLAAGLIVGGDALPIPKQLVSMLSDWEDWELNILMDQLPSMRIALKAAATYGVSRNGQTGIKETTSDVPATPEKTPTGGRRTLKLDRV